MPQRLPPDGAASAAAAAGRPGPPRRLRAATARLAIGAVALLALLAVFAAAPAPQPVQNEWVLLAASLVCLASYAGLTSWAVYHLGRSRYPAADGIALVSVMATLIVLGYAYCYQVLAVHYPGSFSEPLSKAASLYFTVTVLTTVGFGDITPTEDLARLVVTSQMVVGLSVLSLSLKLIVQSARTARRRQALATAPPDGHGDGTAPQDQPG